MKNIVQILMLLAPFAVFAQATGSYTDTSGKQAVRLYASVENGDTIPHVYLRQVSVVHFRNPADYVAWERLKRNVKKVYPYALQARQRMALYEQQLQTLDKRKDRKKFVKEAEKQLMDEFRHDIENMTVNQGIILIKLIDRETGTSSFDIVKELKGSLNAFMWQSVARVFGHNLKSKYDPKGEDAKIEEIVQMIQRGEI